VGESLRAGKAVQAGPAVAAALLGTQQFQYQLPGF